jgi:hypothetical protein
VPGKRAKRDIRGKKGGKGETERAKELRAAKKK